MLGIEKDLAFVHSQRNVNVDELNDLYSQFTRIVVKILEDHEEKEMAEFMESVIEKERCMVLSEIKSAPNATKHFEPKASTSKETNTFVQPVLLQTKSDPNAPKMLETKASTSKEAEQDEGAFNELKLILVSALKSLRTVNVIRCTNYVRNALKSFNELSTIFRMESFDDTDLTSTEAVYNSGEALTKLNALLVNVKSFRPVLISKPHLDALRKLVYNINIIMHGLTKICKKSEQQAVQKGRCTKESRQSYVLEDDVLRIVSNALGDRSLDLNETTKTQIGSLVKHELAKVVSAKKKERATVKDAKNSLEQDSQYHFRELKYGEDGYVFETTGANREILLPSDGMSYRFNKMGNRKLFYAGKEARCRNYAKIGHEGNESSSKSDHSDLEKMEMDEPDTETGTDTGTETDTETEIGSGVDDSSEIGSETDDVMNEKQSKSSEKKKCRASVHAINYDDITLDEEAIYQRKMDIYHTCKMHYGK